MNPNAPVFVPGRKPSYVVIVWNLSRTYNVAMIKEFLWDRDFEAEVRPTLRGLLALDGVLSSAFVLYFEEVWHANCFVVSIDKSNHLEAKRGGELVRAALWNLDTASWSAADVPKSLAESATQTSAGT